MKVGILTMHRVLNYGSIWQAYSLKVAIEELGYEVSFRDFQSGCPRHKGKKIEELSFSDRLVRFFKSEAMKPLQGIGKRIFRAKYRSLLEIESCRMLNISKELNANLTADIMVIGSDEVFNYTQNNSFGYVPCLFGHEIQASRIVSYAASAGYATKEDVIRDDMAQELGDGLKKFTAISVRDENTKSLVEFCSGISPELVLDPTLLVDIKRYISKRKVIEGKYLLVYAYEGRLDANDEVKAVKDYAQKKNLKVVSAGNFHAWCDENIVLTPAEVLAAFRDAEYVVTDTFHGTIFSLVNKRRFVTFIRNVNPKGSNSNKVSYLLRQFSMDSRIVSNALELEKKLDHEVNYSDFESRLNSMRSDSLRFLKKSLGN